MSTILPYKRPGRRKKGKNHVLENVVFSLFAHFCPLCPLYYPYKRQGRRKKGKNHVLENVVFSLFAQFLPIMSLKLPYKRLSVYYFFVILLPFLI